jgi:hypothetical protein
MAKKVVEPLFKDAIFKGGKGGGSKAPSKSGSSKSGY